MPILEVEVVTDASGPVPEGLAATLAEAAARALGSRAGATWVKLRWLPRDMYAEDGAGLPPQVGPVFVTVLEADPPQGRALATEMRALARAVADACQVPVENVHVVYEPGARGRIGFGGELWP